MIQLLFLQIIDKYSKISMNRKQSHETTSQGYGQGPYKISYQVNSPYVELLESKKKVYGHRYDHKPNRSFNNSGPSYIKASPASITSMFPQGSKSIKSSSTQKVKYGRTSTNDKKKRTKTQVADDKMHESLCVYPNLGDKNNEDINSKSLHYGDKKTNNGDFQPNLYFQQLSSKKNKRKRHLSENKYSTSLMEDKYNQSIMGLGGLQNLQINDIEGLISLIDNCVQEANEYIAYLSQKMDTIKQELITVKAQLSERESQLQKKESIIMKKDYHIQKLEHEIAEMQKKQKIAYPSETGFQVKNLLQVIERMNEQNERLRMEIRKGKQEFDQKNQAKNKDHYNQIHSKIDILNISIDSNSPSANKDRKDISKKYKFIKPKGGAR